MRIAIPLALFTAAAFSSHALPVRAYPGPRVNLVRIDAGGVKPLPDVTRLLDAAQAQAPASGPAAAPDPGPAALAPLPTDLTWLLSPGDELEISFRRPLSAGAAGVLLLRAAPAPSGALNDSGDPGREVERVPFPSERVFLSEDRRFMAIQPVSNRNPGEITTVQFELGRGVVPDPETPVRFALAEPAVAMERKVAPCPITPLPGASQAAAQTASQAAGQAAGGAAAAGAAAGTAGWLVPAVIGIVVIGVGAAVVAGSSGGGGGGGGKNPSSQ